MKQSKHLQVAFNYARTLTANTEDELPVQIHLTLSLTPLVPEIEEVRVSINRDSDHTHALTWVGKVTHVLKNVTSS